jgi:hypothetical protein
MSIAVAVSAFERTTVSLFERTASSRSGHGAGGLQCDCARTAPDVRVGEPSLSPAARQRFEAGSVRFPEGIERIDATDARLRTRTESVTNSLAFEVVTRDGDRVQVQLDTSDSRSSARLDVRGPDGALRIASDERSSTRRVSIAIEGQLDDAERAAIDALASDVVTLANDFIEGDGAAALQRAQSLQLGDSLASFSLQLAQRSERTVQAAGYRGEHALAGLARADAGFAATVDAFAGALRDFVLPPEPSEPAAVDAGTRAQLLAGLLPALLQPLDAPEAELEKA